MTTEAVAYVFEKVFTVNKYTKAHMQSIAISQVYAKSLKPGFHYPSWRVTGFHYLSTRAVLTGNGNRSPVNLGRQLG